MGSGIDAFPSLDGPDAGSSDFRVTGHQGTGEPVDEERAKFESAFPDIGDAGAASAIETIPYGATPYPSQPYSATNNASQQQKSTTHTYTSVLPAPEFASQKVTEEDSPAIKEWREKQAEEIKKRDEASKKKREETILKAEKSIDAFYENYNQEKERNIKENK